MDYSRTLSVLDRVSVQRFASDAIMMSAGGLLGHRVDLTVAGGLARGATPAAESASGSYDSYTATTQLRWALARCCATTASYSYYDYTLRNVFVLGGLPSHSTNNGLRVGFTIWLPLYGSGGDNTGTR